MDRTDGTGSALRGPRTVAQPWIHADGGSGRGARDRGQHGGLQRRGPDPVPSPALPGRGAPGICRHDGAARQQRIPAGGRLLRPAAQPRSICSGYLFPGRRRRLRSHREQSLAHAVPAGGGQLSGHAGRAPDSRTCLLRRRGPAERAAGGHDLRRAVAQPVRGRPRRHRQDAQHRRLSDAGGRRVASRFRDADARVRRYPAAPGAG